MRDRGRWRGRREGVAPDRRRGHFARRALPGLFVSLMIAACVPKAEDDVTRRVLVNAHVAMDVVSQLTTRYEETGWVGVGRFRESPEGLATRQFLSEYGKPVPVDPALPRARELEELSALTAKLVNLAVEPRGTWEEFVREVYDVRSRLERALATLEGGTKSYLKIEARTKIEEQALVYSRAVAAANAAAKTAGAGRTP